MVLFCFFFKQKTAYEMRISDWSSDVCCSDLFCESVLRHGRLLLSVSHMKSLQKRSFKRHAGSFGRQKHEGTRRALQTVIESTNFAACGEAIGGMRTIPHPIFVLSPTDRLRTGAALP